MVSFYVLVTSVLLFAESITAQSPAEIIVDNLGSLTRRARLLQSAAQSTTLTDAIYFQIDQGEFVGIVKGLETQTSEIVAYTIKMQREDSNFSGPGADSVSAALTFFVNSEQALMLTLIEKAGLTGTVPLIGQRIVNALKSFKATLPAFETGLIKKVPSKAGTIHDALNGLIQAVDTAAKKYGGLLA